MKLHEGDEQLVKLRNYNTYKQMKIYGLTQPINNGKTSGGKSSPTSQVDQSRDGKLPRLIGTVESAFESREKF